MKAAVSLLRPVPCQGIACQSSLADAFRNSGASGSEENLVARLTTSNRGTSFRPVGRKSVADRRVAVPISSVVAFRSVGLSDYRVRAQSQEVGRSSEEEAVADSSLFSLDALWRVR